MIERFAEYTAVPRARGMIVKRHTLVNAVRAAASIYESDAQDQPARLAEQFQQQSREAYALADQIEQADNITIED